MLVIARARAAVDRAPGLLHHRRRTAKRCRKAALEGRRAIAMRFYCGPLLLVIDEFAYSRTAPPPAPPLHPNATLFEVINWRYLNPRPS